jgi:hypothetical protein
MEQRTAGRQRSLTEPFNDAGLSGVTDAAHCGVTDALDLDDDAVRGLDPRTASAFVERIFKRGWIAGSADKFSSLRKADRHAR